MSIHDYAERGWLERVVRGVYRRALAKGGKLHPVYRIYVPETLLPADGDEDASHA